MHIARRAATLAMVAIVLVGGCSGGSDDESSNATAPTAPTVELPDPCALIPTRELTDLFGKNVGTARSGTEQGRRVCTYRAVVNLAVADVAGFDTAVDDVRENAGGGAVVDVDDVGSQAIWQDFGSAGQLLAKGDRYFVGVTVAIGGRVAAAAVARRMLTGL
jgi:hypothetical protein